MTIAYLGLGANIGDAQQTLRDAIICLAQRAHITVLKKSSIYQSQPIEASGPDFLNAVVCIDTTLSAQALHAVCMTIEALFGRERSYRNAPRTLDIDLLLYGDCCLTTMTLQIPHPRMSQRAFVLLPLAEIAPRIMIPGLGEIENLLSQVTGQRIEKLLSPCYGACICRR